MTNDYHEVMRSKNTPTSGYSAGTNSSGKAGQIKALVSQSFQIFNTFGRDASALAIIVPAFVEDLSPFTTEIVTEAFREWRRDQSRMPTPAEIREIAIRISKNSAKKPAPHQSQSRWIQMIEDWDGSLLGERLPGEHMTTLELMNAYEGQNVTTRMRRV